MKLQTLLWAAGVASVTLLAAAVILAAAAVRNLEEADARDQLASNKLEQIFQLTLVSYDYLSAPSERAREQWTAKYESLGDLIQRGDLVFPGSGPGSEGSLHLQVRDAYEHLGSQLLPLIGDPGNGGDGARGDADPSRLLHQVSLDVHRMYGAALRQARAAHEDRNRAEESLHLISFLAIAFTVVLLLLFLLMTSLRVLRPLSRLQRDMRIVGRGRLAHRSAVGGRDEIGELARAFDSMTEALQAKTTSVDRLNAEIAERQEAEARYRAFFDQSPLGVLVLEPDTLVVREHNERMADMLGCEPGELKGRSLDAYMARDPVETDPALFAQKAALDRDRTLEVSLLTSGGRPIDAEITMRPISIADQVYLQCLVRDVTEVRVQRKRLIQAEKLASLGTMTAGIAHELNNPVMGMMNFIQYAKRRGRDDPKLVDVLGEAEEAGRRVTRIVQDLLSVARSRSSPDNGAGTTRVAETVREVRSLLQFRIGKENVSLSTDVAEELRTAAPKDHVQQILINLITNAVDALGDEGGRRVSVQAEPAGGRIRISVADTGVGIPPEILDRVTEPFFTTKRGTEGTGLGLWLVRRIVEDNGGEMEIRSDSSGTRVTVDLGAA